MGREIRRVPPNWQHPTKPTYNYKTGQYEEIDVPLFDEPYGPAIADWIRQHELWESGKHPDQLDGSCRKFRYYAMWGGNPPQVEGYRPDWTSEEATWWQVYETVSEGTPVTPPFATREELVEYLVQHGDFWDQRRLKEGNRIPCSPWPRKQAEAFVFGDGWAPTLVVQNGNVMPGVEALAKVGRA